MLLIYSYFTFLDGVKAILVHCAHRLLSELTRILCTLKNELGAKQTPGDFTRLRSIPEAHAFSTVRGFFRARICYPAQHAANGKSTNYLSGPRKDHRGADLISDSLPFGRLLHGEPNAIANAT
jgi:hypothetical protein